nr:amiloride-sensitive amine oxidase [copper-containing] [Quercus suber]
MILSRNRLPVALYSLLLFVALAIFLILSFGPDLPSNNELNGKIAGFKAGKQNIWAELTESEAFAVNDFVLLEYKHLNLTKRPSSARDNFVLQVEALRPNKSDAISYLYDQGLRPERWAKVVLSENREDGPCLVYYMVGPLPVSKATRILPLRYTFNSGNNSVINPIFDFPTLMDYALSLAENVSDITQDLLGASANRKDPKDPNGLLIVPRSSRIDTGGMVLWMQFYRPGLKSSARSILPQGLYVKIYASDPHMENWKTGQYHYNGITYEHEQAFRRAIQTPGFKRTAMNLDGPWTDTEDFESSPDGRDLPPPVTVQPYGPRYKLDRKQNFISWFGFDFYITTSQATGVSIFDIKFKGQRVMYELGLQEAMAHYAGDDPLQGGLEFLDTFFGMGKNAFELLPGYDCPAYADYLDVEWHSTYETHKMPNSICVFEFTAEHLLSRHTAQQSVTASRNTFLVVRSVSTVGNYDYTIDYIFYLDGTLEVKVRASGFIFGAFFKADDTDNKDEYGHRIHDALSSSMHDHVINFKAGRFLYIAYLENACLLGSDLDVVGPVNDMVRLVLEPTTKTYPWDLPEIQERNTMHLVEYPVLEETGIDWPKNSGELYLIYSTTETNAWGERKGYRITPGTGMGSTPHLTIVNSTTLGESARWAEHDIWVLQRKDTEPRSADPLNFLSPKDPIIDFTKMANHESLDHGVPETDYDGDLVVYFNLGAHHIPHSGDIPNTLMHTSASSVMFVPHNFMDRDPSRESVQGVRVQMKGKNSGGFAGEPGGDGADLKVHKRWLQKKTADGHTKAHYFGATYEGGVEISARALEPVLDGYVSKENLVTDLGMNGSAAGVWYPRNI